MIILFPYNVQPHAPAAGPPRAGQVHVEFFLIVVFYQKVRFSGSFKLIYMVLKKQNVCRYVFTKAIVAGSTTAARNKQIYTQLY
jgi:hypothetical protein